MRGYRIERVNRAIGVAFLGLMLLLVDVIVAISGWIPLQVSLSIMYLDAAVTGAAVVVIWAEQPMRGAERW